ncbi:MAG TPA: hypothetical protein VEU96_03680 [Bryobacteraceae bacterium]|nr:hypothetical protein [Bryobacteraceae bacterium]
MKSKDDESTTQLPTVPDSAEDAVHDFLYVDRVRVSALYAQLFPQGTLTSVKTTSQTGFSDDKNVGSDLKIIKAESKYSTLGHEGIEHVFDASWAVPLEVLAVLKARSLVRRSLKDPVLGAVVLLDAHLRIIDYATMKDLWEPALNAFVGEEKAAEMKGLVSFIKGVPHTMHAHFLTSEALLWASLEPGSLTVPSADIVLKHGGLVSGSWKVLFVVDAFPVYGDPPEFHSWSAGQATEGVLNAINLLRTQIGRPHDWFGCTPLMIYRDIPPDSGQESLNLTVS